MLRLLVLLLAVSPALRAELDVLQIPGRTLRDNPLGDPPARRVALYRPDAAKADAPLPLVVYLPGWGSSAEDFIAQGAGHAFNRLVQRLAADGLALRLAVVDGRSRYGGSQFLDSTATGPYARYIADEIVPEIEARHPTAPHRRIISGHSSGGYGALLLAMNRQDTFDAVVALSPDSDFETTHKPIVQQASVRGVTPADLAAAMAPPGKSRLPADGTAALVMGLCANYAPTKEPGRFEWLYDERGAWRDEVWQRWLALDPLTLVRKNERAFATAQAIYLDGAEHDEFGANIGARKIHEVLQPRRHTVTFYESPGHHSDRLVERFERGLRWVSRPKTP